MLNLQNLDDAKGKLSNYDTSTFTSINNSFKHFVNKLKINEFRHIRNLDITFNHPVTIITGNNRIGKTSLLLLIACSHHKFEKYDSTKPNTHLRLHTWRDVLPLTSYESTTNNYSYELTWRLGTNTKNGEGKRLA